MDYINEDEPVAENFPLALKVIVWGLGAYVFLSIIYASIHYGF